MKFAEWVTALEKTGPQITLLELWIAHHRASKKFDRNTIAVDKNIIQTLNKREEFIVKVVSKILNFAVYH